MKISEHSTLSVLAQCEADNWEETSSKDLTSGDDFDVHDKPLVLPAVVDLSQDPETDESDSDGSSVYEEVNEDSPVVDMEDNLTYHEDTLSIFKCTVDTPLGNDLQLWVTTDSGSMCCLMHSAMARKLKLTAIPLSSGRRYQIRGPGGGAEEVTHEVHLRVAVNMRHAPNSDTDIPLDEMGQI